MRRMGALLVVFAAIILAASPLRAEDNISVRAEINKGFLTIGERANYTVLIRHSPQVKVTSVIEFPNTRDFEVKSFKDIAPKEEKGTVVEGRKFEIAAYGLGEFMIDPVPVRYLGENKQEQEIQTNALYITVESVDKSGRQKFDIRGIKGPADVKMAIKRWLGLGAVGLTMTIAGILIFAALRKKQLAGPPVEPLLSPHDEALQALQKLFDSSLLREGKVKEYFFRLSEIIRGYLERRYEISAIESTTEEIQKELTRIELESGLRTELREFLMELDLVKFAKYMPEPQEILKANRHAKELVEKTKPAETLLPADGPAGSEGRAAP